ncbi:LD-carboxypeptidase [Paenibacillus hunanensis]|uniref:S66 family peptidase n=1 Tax=Paenibacillus hunanensis TaxID=539262 RepID=UPI002A69E523|nr:S66 peptidase family protein [Paenibacillus hunanensis]WPP39565.1 LD-carboxypeptidase [Paenibacillus hunanensis]
MSTSSSFNPNDATSISSHPVQRVPYPSAITFPAPLQPGDRIALTAPSSGVRADLHQLVYRMRDYLTELGYEPVIGDSMWTNYKCVSLPKAERAAELERYLLDEEIKAIIPPWGGEFLMELLPLLNWERIRHLPPKWILGFSDISTLTFAYTLQTGYGSAHGPSGVDIAQSKDETTSRWHDLLTAASGQSIEQSSSAMYQSTADYSRAGFTLDAPTRWDWLGHEQQSDEELTVSGRLIGGCLDVLAALVGTPWARVTDFIQQYGEQDGMIWYLESCELNAGAIYRHLWQMRQAGWFQHTHAVLIGRPAGYEPLQEFELIDALHMVFDELNIPVVYGVDIGHIPPQITMINGALAKVHVQNGSGTVTQTLA